jgi:hypothetical protein
MNKSKIKLMDELLQQHFNNFQMLIGNEQTNLSERAKECLRKAMQEYAERQILDFCCHLNTYSGLEEARFDFMLVDFLNK